jgi:hypothetical protein
MQSIAIESRAAQNEAADEATPVVSVARKPASQKAATLT